MQLCITGIPSEQQYGVYHIELNIHGVWSVERRKLRGLRLLQGVVVSSIKNLGVGCSHPQEIVERKVW